MLLVVPPTNIRDGGTEANTSAILPAFSPSLEFATRGRFFLLLGLRMFCLFLSGVSNFRRVVFNDLKFLPSVGGISSDFHVSGRRCRYFLGRDSQRVGCGVLIKTAEETCTRQTYAYCLRITFS